MPGEKDDKGFRVIDRRGREETPSSPSAPPPGETPVSPGAEDGAPPKPPPEDPRPADVREGNLPGPEGVQPGKGREEGPPSLGAPRFLDLVDSLQMGAMANLGLLQGPDGKRSPVNLPGAKDAIDLLGILQEKTKGNLTKEEEEVLREGLYHLRMGYMAMLKAPPAGRGKGGENR